MNAISPINAEFPEKLSLLFQPARYKVLYGGRGGAKSWGVARALLIQSLKKPLRILCAREFQNSIKESVHRLLSDQIAALGLESFYEIQQAGIYGRNGSAFYFEGIKNNVTRIKSFEGIDVCWVEEAQSVTKSSWDVIIPTIRKDGSEIIVTMNPDMAEDESYQRFVVNPPINAIVQKVNWSDNPYFPEVLRQEMEDLKARDVDSWLNVWEGECRRVLEGAVYAKEIRSATEENRFTKVPYDHNKGVLTFWDLGWADATCIWFAQVVGFEYHIIDYVQDTQQSITHYLKVLQEKPYVYTKHWLPHDAKSKALGTGRSIEEIMRSAGVPVQIVPRLSLYDGINAARTIFPNCYFDEKKCEQGLNALRHYKYEIVPGTGMFGKNPVHDWASHGADGFRYLATALREKQVDTRLNLAREGRQRLPKFPGGANTGWLSI